MKLPYINREMVFVISKGIYKIHQQKLRFSTAPSTHNHKNIYFNDLNYVEQKIPMSFQIQITEAKGSIIGE